MQDQVIKRQQKNCPDRTLTGGEIDTHAICIAGRARRRRRRDVGSGWCSPATTRPPPPPDDATGRRPGVGVDAQHRVRVARERVDDPRRLRQQPAVPLVPPRGEIPDDVDRVRPRVDPQHARGGIRRGVNAPVRAQYPAWRFGD